MNIIIAALLMGLAPLALALVALGIRGARPVPRWWTARWERRAFRRALARYHRSVVLRRGVRRIAVTRYMIGLRAASRARSINQPTPKRVNRHQRRAALRWGLSSGSPDPNTRTNFRRHGVWAGRKVRNPHPRTPLALRRAKGAPNTREIRSRFAAAGVYLGTQEGRFLRVPTRPVPYRRPAHNSSIRRVDPRAVFLRPVRDARTAVRVAEAHLEFAERRVLEAEAAAKRIEEATWGWARLARPINTLQRLRDVMPGADRRANAALRALREGAAAQVTAWAFRAAEVGILLIRREARRHDLALAEERLALAEARAPRRFRPVQPPEEGLFDGAWPWGIPRAA